ncbi:adenine phosphoribosyltransferase [Syngnathoides biaculeatus]|uniref:adenine phosphoribosyltransferase n=1 Tax=Syngnathoides biaculeatus TaxID=300417 RepID=UPI002ADE2490|nr:adenine phosphoribosyltransferase [Syngnathoides biaculeatus]
MYEPAWPKQSRQPSCASRHSSLRGVAGGTQFKRAVSYLTILIYPGLRISESKIQLLRRHINAFPDFPKKGILFRDICPILRDPTALTAVIDLFEEHVKNKNWEVDLIVGLDARGFLFGPLLAQRLGVGFVMVRKKGKLPGVTVSVAYDLEYGKAEAEVQEDAVTPGQKVVLLDDLLATGGPRGRLLFARSSQLMPRSCTPVFLIVNPGVPTSACPLIDPPPAGPRHCLLEFPSYTANGLQGPPHLRSLEELSTQRTPGLEKINCLCITTLLVL